MSTPTSSLSLNPLFGVFYKPSYLFCLYHKVYKVHIFLGRLGMRRVTTVNSPLPCPRHCLDIRNLRLKDVR